jgi:hypothetical protein
MPGPLTVPTLTIVCQYDCPTCGIRDRSVEVAERGANEDIVTWVRAVADVIGADHARVVPGCRGKTCKLKIPWPDTRGRIGDAMRQ